MQGTLAGRLAASLLNVLFPSECPLCASPPDNYATSPLCLDCWSGIRQYRGHSCNVCSEPLVSGLSGTCGRCLSEKPPFESARSFGLYEGALKEAVLLLKFGPARRLAKPLGKLLCTLDLPRADIIVPVPVSAGVLRSRGFCQTRLIARQLSKATGIPIEARALRKTKETPPQEGLSRSARMKNLIGAFEAPMPLVGRTVLLVDDVITTGSTLRECSRALRKAGAKEVRAVSVARASSLVRAAGQAG